MDCYTWAGVLAHSIHRLQIKNIYGYRYVYASVCVFMCLLAYQISNVMDERSVEVSCRARIINAHVNNMYLQRNTVLFGDGWYARTPFCRKNFFLLCSVFACSISFAHLNAHARAIQFHRCCLCDSVFALLSSAAFDLCARVNLSRSNIVQNWKFTNKKNIYIFSSATCKCWLYVVHLCTGQRLVFSWWRGAFVWNEISNRCNFAQHL